MPAGCSYKKNMQIIKITGKKAKIAEETKTAETTDIPATAKKEEKKEDKKKDDKK